MGHTHSRAENGDFTGVLPTEHRTKSTTVTADVQCEALAVARPVETAIPLIHAPPHALLREKHAEPTTRQPSSGSSRPETPRRGGDDHQSVFAVPESVRKSHTLQQFEQTCSEILPGFLYVSNLNVAQDRSELKAQQITHVINCCKEVVCFKPIDDDSISYLQLALRDGVQEDLLPFFPQVTLFIERCRLLISDNGAKKTKVLIHCHQGVSRSCAFAIAYVMYHTRCSFQDANALVKAKRSICSPNTAFICQLIEWERELAAVVAPNATSYGLYRLAPHAVYDPSTWILKLCYHDGSRRKVSVATSEGDGQITDKWLWSRGIFVFVNKGSNIIIWKGCRCMITDGVAQAKAHVETMLQVFAGTAAPTEMPIIVVEQQPGDTPDDRDEFGYATELSWLEVSSSTPAHQLEEETEPELKQKPMLFTLDGDVERSWEWITDYSSDDLLPDAVLLLVTPSDACLWIGGQATFTTIEELQLLAAQKIQGRTSSSIVRVEKQDRESEAFWDAFEAGY